MLTLKLRHVANDRMTIIECDKVDISAEGDGYKVAVTSHDACVVYRVAKDAEYDVGYVENSAGSTTQVIKPRPR